MSKSNQVVKQEEKLIEVSAEIVSKADVLISKYEKYAVVETEEELSGATECAAQIKAVVKSLNDERLKSSEPSRNETKRINDKYNKIIDELNAALKVPVKGAKDFMQKMKDKAEAAERERQRQEDADRRAAEEAQREADERAAEAKRKAEEAEAKASRARKPENINAAKEEADRQAKIAADADAEAEAAAIERARVAEENAKKRSSLAKDQANAKRSTGTLNTKSALVDNYKYRIVDINAVPDMFLAPPEERVNKAMLAATAKNSKGAKSTIPGIEFYNDPYLRNS